MIPGFGRSPGEGSGYPLQYSGLERDTQESRKESNATERLSLYRAFPGGSVVKNLPANAEDEGDADSIAGLITGLGRCSRGGSGNPL